MGIDPGTVVMGYGIIKVTGKEIRLIKMDVLRLSAKYDAYQKLQKIHDQVTTLIHDFQPHHFAIEAPFFGKNVQSMLKLGRAQGVAIAAAMQAAVPVFEYSPKKVKQSITGNGNSGKEQVMKMLQQLLHFKDVPDYADSSDALAVAVCHHFQENTIIGAGETKNWKSFLAANPGRIIKR